MKEIANSLKAELFIISDLIKIRDLTYGQRRDFLSYMDRTLKIMNIGVQEGQRIAFNFEHSVNN